MNSIPHPHYSGRDGSSTTPTNSGSYASDHYKNSLKPSGYQFVYPNAISENTEKTFLGLWDWLTLTTWTQQKSRLIDAAILADEGEVA